MLLTLVLRRIRKDRYEDGEIVIDKQGMRLLNSSLHSASLPAADDDSVSIAGTNFSDALSIADTHVSMHDGELPTRSTRAGSARCPAPGSSESHNFSAVLACQVPCQDFFLLPHNSLQPLIHPLNLQSIEAAMHLTLVRASRKDSDGQQPLEGMGPGIALGSKGVARIASP